MKKEVVTFTAYEALLDKIDAFMKEQKISTRPEAIRTALEMWLAVPEEDRKAYRESIISGRAKGHTSIKRKKGRKKILRKILPQMEKGKFYTLTEVSEMAEVSRRIIRDDVIVKYQEYFVIDEKANGTYQLKKRSKKARDKYKEDQEKFIKEMKEKLHRKEIGLEEI